MKLQRAGNQLSAKQSALALAGVAVAIALLVMLQAKREERRRRDVALTVVARRIVPFKVQFRDVTKAAGISFKHNDGAFGAHFFPEPLGSGAAFIDFDDDGWQDIFLVNGRNWTQAELDAYRNGNGRAHKKKHGWDLPPNPSKGRTTGALYRNNRDGTFSDVSRGSGLDVEIYGSGAAVGDYDNDGRDDLYITAFPRNYLFRNLSPRMSTHASNGISTDNGTSTDAPAGKSALAARARFQDVTLAAGIAGSGYSTSAAWVDYDRDGRLDLFVGRYVQWTPSTDFYAGLRGRKTDSAPRSYQGVTGLLFHNEGRNHFRDVSIRAGVARRGKSEILGKSLGVATCDFNQDGWPDVAVANDTEPNFLFKNNRNGTFSEVGRPMGIAVNEAGRARAGMGIDAADIDNSGRDSFVIGNFTGESLGLYADAGGTFRDIAPRVGITSASELMVTFGCLFLDIDLDGWLDILAANGHVHRFTREEVAPTTTEQKTLLFHNQGKHPALFEDISEQSGAALQQSIVGRGLASADIDGDGDLDVLVTTRAGSPRLLRNDGGNRNNALRVTLQGTKSNRDGIGATVTARVENRNLRRAVKSGSSYLSQSELPITFGLGRVGRISQLSVQWPSGKRSTFKNLQANNSVLIDEDKGILWTKALNQK